MTYLRESAAIDWLTLTTWNFPNYLDLVAYMHRRHPGDWRPSKVMQYSGKKRGNMFYGHAEQTARDGEKAVHCMIRVSGQESDDFFFNDLKWWGRSTSSIPRHQNSPLDVWKCTRIDLQLTKNPPKRYNLASAYKRLAHPKSIVQSEKTTLYIGNRAESDTFIRLYEKMEFLRLELELKGHKATWAFRNLLNGVHPNDLYETALSKSRVPVMYVNHFETDGQIIDMSRVEKERDNEKRLTWLKSLDGCIYQMLSDHDIGDETRELINRWAEYGENLAQTT